MKALMSRNASLILNDVKGKAAIKEYLRNSSSTKSEIVLSDGRKFIISPTKS